MSTPPPGCLAATAEETLPDRAPCCQQAAPHRTPTPRPGSVSPEPPAVPRPRGRAWHGPVPRRILGEMPWRPRKPLLLAGAALDQLFVAATFKSPRAVRRALDQVTVEKLDRLGELYRVADAEGRLFPEVADALALDHGGARPRGRGGPRPRVAQRLEAAAPGLRADPRRGAPDAHRPRPVAQAPRAGAGDPHHPRVGRWALWPRGARVSRRVALPPGPRRAAVHPAVPRPARRRGPGDAGVPLDEPGAHQRGPRPGHRRSSRARAAVEGSRRAVGGDHGHEPRRVHHLAGGDGDPRASPTRSR